MPIHNTPQMSLVSLTFSEGAGVRTWVLKDATFGQINLVVGRNSTGKSRLVSVINSLSRTLQGKQKLAPEEAKFCAVIEIGSRIFRYELETLDGNVQLERLLVDGLELLTRDQNGDGTIFYEKENRTLDFKLPSEVVAAVNRRDEIQHPFLMDLHTWAQSIALYQFGSDFGKSQIIPMAEMSTLMSAKAPAFDDTNQLTGIYSRAFLAYGDAFDQAVIADMRTLGYELSDVRADDLQKYLAFPISVLGMLVVETDLGFPVPQLHMSQGMFRALALAIHLNVCVFGGLPKTLLVDDIGEGLDYERAVAIIDLLISKANEFGFQLVMTSNDRFVMNNVPLEHWSVLRREKGIVSMFNERNVPDKFKQFKFLGLNNFDFFASDYLWSDEVAI